MRKFFVFFLVMLVALGAIAPVAAQADSVVAAIEEYQSEIPPYGTISAGDLGTLLIEQEVILLDVREVAEYEEGHIDGAFNVPIRELAKNLDLLPDIDAEIYVICQGGARAMLATASLHTLGYDNAITLAGGMGAWTGEGFPVTTEEYVPMAATAPELDAEVLAAVDEYLSTLPEGFGLIRADALSVELIENPDLFLLDVRSPDEWANGYIAGTEFAWVNEFMSSLDVLPADLDTPIVVYCASSYRGGIVTVWLRLLGYSDVRNLVGGINAWVAAGLPLEGVPEAAEVDPVFAAIEEYQSEIPPYGTISAGDLGTLLIEEEAILLDVREVAEYEEGHIDGAFNVPIRTLTQNLDLLPDLDAEIYVICAGGARAMLATASLHTLGYDNAITLAGGMGAWNGEGFPVTTEAYVPMAATAPELDAEVLAAVDEYLSTLPEGFDLIRADALSVELVENPDLYLLDVRSPEEWETGYIAGAEFAWVNEFTSSLDVLPENMDTPIVVYCASSYRGGIVTVWLRLLGYSDVRNLVGGINAWVAAGLPLEGAPAEQAGAEDAAFDLPTYLNDYLMSLPASFNAIRVPDVADAIASDDVPVLLDVRTVDEYTEGHIEGAINIPLNELTAHLDQLPDLEADIIVYCGSGHRSALAMTALNLLGYENALSMLGGVRAWGGADLPLTDVVTTAEMGTAPEFNPDVFAAVDAYITSIPAGYWVVRSDDLNVELVESDIFLIDVRTDGEWADGYIGGAVHIPLETLVADMSMLPAMDADIVVYDNPTHRSSMAMTILRMLGYENVRTFGGGFGAWANAELPVEMP